MNMEAEHELRSQIAALATLMGSTIAVLRECRLMNSEQIEGLFANVRQVVNVPEMANANREGWSSALAMAQVAASVTSQSD